MEQTRRRDLLIAGAAIALGASIGALPIRPARGQTSSRIRRVAYLSASPARFVPPFLEPFVQGLRELGWTDGQNLVIDIRAAEGKPERLPELATELARSNIDVITVVTNATAIAAKKATNSVPIVVFAAHGAVEAGLASSLAHPGGNVTGSDSMAPTLDAKRLELVREIIPTASRIGVLYNIDDVASVAHVKAIMAPAQAIGLEVHPMGVNRVDDPERAFAALEGKRLNALLAVADGSGLISVVSAWAAKLPLKYRLPAVYELKEFVLSGGLISYGPSISSLLRRGAYFVDRILKGARPADLPIEHPTAFELVVNLKTAKELGLRIPQSILLRADRVIE